MSGPAASAAAAASAACCASKAAAALASALSAFACAAFSASCKRFQVFEFMGGLWEEVLPLWPLLRLLLPPRPSFAARRTTSLQWPRSSSPGRRILRI